MTKCLAWVAAFTLTLSACAPVETRYDLSRRSGESYASVGDIVLRVSKLEDLPNMFGRADLFGRTRERGFVEIRYVGLGAAGHPVFRRRDVDIISTETTMSRTGGFGSSIARGSANSTGGQFSASGFIVTPASSVTVPLPADTTEFVVDLSKGRRVTAGVRGFDILEASASGVRVRTY